MNYRELQNVSDATLKGKAINDLVTGATGGAHQVAAVTIGANITDADTITIGADVFELHIIATDTTANGNDEFAASTTAKTLNCDGAHALAVGAVILIGTEFMLVEGVPSTTSLTLQRGYAGSTAANHADDQDILEAAQALDSASTFPIPLAAVTAAAVGNGMAAAITAFSTEGVTCAEVADGEVLLSRVADGVQTAITETFDSGSNVSDAAFHGGVEPGQGTMAVVSRVPTATEVTLTNMSFVFPFDVTAALITGTTTATGAKLILDGVLSISGGRVTVNNGGSVDWATTSTVTCIASGSTGTAP